MMPAAHRTVAKTPAAALSCLCALLLAVCGTMLTPAPALAQSDKWEVEVAPLYFWAARLDGDIGVNDATVPIFMSFADALDKAAGSFALHVGAQKGRWGVLGDVYFLRLETGATFTTPVIPREITGEAELGMVIVEAGMTWEVKRGSSLNLIGGLRTYTLSPTVTFTGDTLQHSPIDTSQTAVGGFGGITFRPKLGRRAQLPGPRRHRGRSGVHVEQHARRRVPVRVLGGRHGRLQGLRRRHRRGRRGSTAREQGRVLDHPIRSHRLADVPLDAEVVAP